MRHHCNTPFPVLTREQPPKRKPWESEHYRISQCFPRFCGKSSTENAARFLFGAIFRGTCCENFCGSSGKNQRSCCVLAENNASAFHVHPASPSGPVSNSFPLKLFQLNHSNAIFIDHNCDDLQASHSRTGNLASRSFIRCDAQSLNAKTPVYVRQFALIDS